MDDAYRLKQWFLEKKRVLPWREACSPYGVWVSEIMLQQTQVAAVIPYFHRWMQRLPTIESLATANEDLVMKLWEGLGYYSRARSLHQGAQVIMSHFGGKLPQEESILLEIPGIGPYTAAAISSFAFKRRALALDGNVIRVLSRYFAVGGDITKSKVREDLKNKGDILLCVSEPWKSAEALIELGALVCKRKPPLCLACPLKQNCQAYITGTQAQLPVRPIRKAIRRLFRVAIIAKSGTQLLVRKNSSRGIMQGLWEFPFVEIESAEDANPKMAEMWLNERSLSFQYERDLPEHYHTFTHHKVRLYPYLFEVCVQPLAGYLWIDVGALLVRAFSSGHRRVLLDVRSLLGTYVQ